VLAASIFSFSVSGSGSGSGSGSVSVSVSVLVEMDWLEKEPQSGFINGLIAILFERCKNSPSVAEMLDGKCCVQKNAVYTKSIR